MSDAVPGFPGVKQSTLRRLAARYLWWMTPEEALRRPARVIVQVMELGDYDDVLAMWQEVGDDGLRKVLQASMPGELSPRSWNYWHVRLGLAEPGGAPPMPVRQFQ